MTKHSIIKIHDAQMLNRELSQIQSIIEKRETEDNWLQIDDAYVKLIAIIKGSSDLPSLPASIKKLKRPIQESLLTERTRLSRTVMLVCEELGKNLQERFEPLSDFVIPSLLKLCTRANKVFITCASATIKTIVLSTKLPSLLPFFMDSLKLPSKSLRIAAFESIEKCLECCDPHHIGMHYLDLLEESITVGVVDSTLGVRELARTIFSLYSNLFPLCIDGFVATLSENCKKHLKVNKPPSTIESSHGGKQPGTAAPNTTNTSTVRTMAPGGGSSFKPLKERMDQDTNPNLMVVGQQTPLVGIFNRQKTNLSFFDENGNVMKPEDIVQSRLRNNPHLANVPRRLMMDRPSRVQVDPNTNIQQDHPNNHHNIINSMKPSSSIHHMSMKNNKPSKVMSTDMHIHSSVNSATVSGSSKMTLPARKPQTQENERSSNSRMNTAASSRVQSPDRVSSKVSRTREPSISAMSRSEDQVFDLNSLLLDAKSSNWSKRVHTFESLSEFLYSSSSLQFKQAQSKLIELYVVGLGDAHFKVVQTVIQSLTEYLSRNIAQEDDGFSYPQEAINALLPRLASILHNPQQRSKPGVFEVGMKAYQGFKNQYSSESICLALVSSLNNPEFARNGKIKVGIIAMMAEMECDDWKKYLTKTSHMKTVLFRLSSLCGDPEVIKDQELGKAMIRLFRSLYRAAGSDMFFAGWSVVKQADKKHVSKMLGAKGDLITDKRVLMKKDNTPKETFSPGTFRSGPSNRASPFRSYFTSIKSPISTLSTPTRSSNSIIQKVDTVSPIGSGLRTPTRFVIRSRRASGDQDELDDNINSNINNISVLQTVDENSVLVDYPSIATSSILETSTTKQTIQAALNKLALERPSSQENSVFLEKETITVTDRHVHIEQRLDDHDDASVEEEDMSISGMALNPQLKSFELESKEHTEVERNTIPNYTSNPSMTDHEIVQSGGPSPAPSVTAAILSPTKLREVLLSENDEDEFCQYEIFESYSVSHEDDDSYMTHFPPHAAEGIETVQMRIKNARPVSFAPNVNGMLNIIMECLMDEDKTTQTVKNTLVLLKESLLSHSSIIQFHATDVLLAILNSESGKNCTTDDLLEIAFEIDATLNAFETKISKPRILRAADYVLKSGGSQRLCFDMLSRVLIFEKMHPEMMKGQEEIYLSEEPNATQFGWDDILSTALKCLESRKLSIRKCAFELIYQYTMVKSNPKTVYHLVGTKYGSLKEMVLRGMMEQRMVQSSEKSFDMIE